MVTGAVLMFKPGATGLDQPGFLIGEGLPADVPLRPTGDRICRAD